jgi:hypothetical protein
MNAIGQKYTQIRNGFDGIVFPFYKELKKEKE